GVAGLGQGLLKPPELFTSTLAEKLLTLAPGRGGGGFDAPAVRKEGGDAKGDNYRFSAIVLGIVNNTPFKMRPKVLARLLPARSCPDALFCAAWAPLWRCPCSMPWSRPLPPKLNRPRRPCAGWASSSCPWARTCRVGHRRAAASWISFRLSSVRSSR